MKRIPSVSTNSLLASPVTQLTSPYTQYINPDTQLSFYPLGNSLPLQHLTRLTWLSRKGMQGQPPLQPRHAGAFSSRLHLLGRAPSCPSAYANIVPHCFTHPFPFWRSVGCQCGDQGPGRPEVDSDEGCGWVLARPGPMHFGIPFNILS